MCLDLSAYVYARTYERLISRGVSDRKAHGVARKVAQRYEDKRRAALLAYGVGGPRNVSNVRPSASRD